MIFKRVSAFIICFIMLLCTVPVGAITIENDDNYDYESEGYSPDELVNVFVVLSDKPIADISYNVKSILTADSAIFTDDSITGRMEGGYRALDV